MKGPPPGALAAATHAGFGLLQGRGQSNVGAQELQGAMGGEQIGQEQRIEQGMQQAPEQAFSQGLNQEMVQGQSNIGEAESLSPTAAFTGNAQLGSQPESSSFQSLSPSLLANQPLQTQMQSNEQALSRTAETGTSLGGSVGGGLLASQGRMLTQSSTQGMMGAGGFTPQAGFVSAPMGQGMTGMAQGMTGMAQGMMGQMQAVGGLQPMTFKKVKLIYLLRVLRNTNF